MTFDRTQLRARHMLTHLRLLDIPGMSLPDDVKGLSGHDLISTDALSALIRQHEKTLGLVEDADDSTARAYFRVLLSAEDKTALHIAQKLGRNLGYLLLMLRRGDAINREANDWDDAYWEHWKQVERVHLAGGLLAGKFGEMVAQQANVIAGKGAANFTIDVADNPPHLALLGAARYVETAQSTMVFDFGSTYVKRARAQYGEYGLQRLHILDRVPINIGVDATREDAQRIFNRMVTTISETYEQVVDGMIPLCIAAHVDANGQPLPDQGGIYANIRYLSENVQTMMSDVLSRRIRRGVQVKFMNDVAAAASVYAGEENAAVLMIGSSLKVAFPLVQTHLRPIGKDVIVVDARRGYSIG